MKVLVVSSAPLIKKENGFSAYSPYASELEIWEAAADSLSFACPVWENDRGLLNANLNFAPEKVYDTREFSIKSFRKALLAVKDSGHNFAKLIRAMKEADHIHLRCPGNIALMACLIQIFFPSKPKTAKYAGNWDPKAKQPLGYRLQRRILSNTFLTRNMQVLVYGEWPGQTKNIRSFFTASYAASEREMLAPRSLDQEIRLLFVGTLSPGKNPEYAIRLLEGLRKRGIAARLDFFGEGKERQRLEKYIADNGLGQWVSLRGNVASDLLKEEIKKSHFVILPSKSEGWPKAVAEAMFWGSIPVSTPVSCVRYMLGNGARGLLLELDAETDVAEIAVLLDDKKRYETMSREGMSWSQEFTTDRFALEIKKLLET